MPVYNPYTNQGSYYSPYENTQQPRGNVGEALFQTAKTMVVMGALNVVGNMAWGALSRSSASLIKNYGRGKLADAARRTGATTLGGVVKSTSTGNVLNNMYKRATSRFRMSLKSRDQYISRVAKANGPSAAAAARFTTTFRDFNTFAGTTGRMWKKNVLQGAGVAYAIDSFFGFTQEMGLEKKSLFDVPGKVGNFAKWLAYDTVFSGGLAASTRTLKAAGGAGVLAARKAFGGAVGDSIVRGLSQVHPGMPVGVKNQNIFKKEVLAFAESNAQQHQMSKAARAKIILSGAGGKARESIGALNNLVRQTGQNVQDAWRTQPTLAGRFKKAVVDPTDKALTQIKDIWKQKALNRKQFNPVEQPGIRLLQFVDDFSQRIENTTSYSSFKQGPLSNFIDVFSPLNKKMNKKNILEEIFPQLRPVRNRDIVSQDWVSRVTGNLSRLYPQDESKRFMDMVLNMRPGLHTYRSPGGKITGGGVDLSFMDPLKIMRRTTAAFLSKPFHIPGFALDISLGDLVGANIHLSESPNFEFFEGNIHFDMGKKAKALAVDSTYKPLDRTTGMAADEPWYTTYVDGKLAYISDAGIHTVDWGRKLKFAAPNATWRRNEQHAMNRAAYAAQMQQQRQLEKGVHNSYLQQFIDKSGLQLPGLATRLLENVTSVFQKGGKNKSYRLAAGVFDSPNPHEWYKYSNVVKSIRDHTGQDIVDILKNKDALKIIADVNHASQFGDAFDVMVNSRSLRQRLEDMQSIHLKEENWVDWLNKRGIREEVDLIQTYPKIAEGHLVTKRVGRYRELNAYDKVRLEVIEDVFNQWGGGYTSGSGKEHPILKALPELKKRGYVNARQEKALALRAKLSAFVDTGVFGDGFRPHTDPIFGDIAKIAQQESKRLSHNIQGDIIDYIGEQKVRNPSLRTIDTMLGEQPRIMRNQSPYVSVGGDLPTYMHEYTRNVFDSVTSMLNDTIFPFRKDPVRHWGLRGNLKYVGGAVAKTAAAIYAFRVLDSTIAANPLFDDTAMEDGLGPFIGENIARARLGTSRAFDALGVTGVAKHLNGLMPGFTTSAPGAVIGSVVSRTLGGGPLEMAKWFAGGAIANRMLSPYLPDFTKSYDELAAEYRGEVEVPMMKSPTWLLGTTPWEGSKVIGYQPNWYVRMKSRWQETDTLYGSTFRRLIHEPLPLIGTNIGDFLDPYYMERKHYFSRPYPVTGRFGEEVPLIGPLIAGTLGKIIKPPRTMRQEFLDTGGEDYNDIASQTYPFSNPPPTLHEGMGLMKHSKGVRTMGGRSSLQGTFRYGKTKLWAHSAGEDFLSNVQNFAGLPGFLGETVSERLLDKPAVLPTLETAGRIASQSRAFFDANLGGVGIFTEPIRRLVTKPEYRRHGINPIPNLMPNWLPEEFLQGDPYCVTGRTLIEINSLDGLTLKRADNVTTRDRIRTHTGTIVKPSAITKRSMSSSEKLYRLGITSLAAFPIEASEEHPIYTTKGWIKIKDIEIGDYVGYPIPDENEWITESNQLDISLYTNRDLPWTSFHIYTSGCDQAFATMIEYIESNQKVYKRGELKTILEKFGWNRSQFEHAQYAVKKGYKSRIPRYIDTSDIRWGRLIGYYLSEGFIIKSKGKPSGVGFAFHKDELEYHNEVKEAVKYIFGLDCHDYEHGNGKNIHVNSSAVGILFSRLFGSGFDNKILIPQPKDTIKEAIRTLFNGDGSYFFDKGKPRLSLKLNNPLLLYQVRHYLLTEGYISNIIENNLILRGQTAKECALFLGTKYTETRDSSFTCTHTKIENGYVWMRVFKKEIISNEDVYGFQVDTDDSFCTAGIATHNTKIIKGELRLPGEAYNRTHMDVRRSMPARASMIGGEEEHMIQYFTGLLPPMLKEEYDIVNKGTAMHEVIQKHLAAEGLLIQAETLVYDAKRDISGHIDAIIKDGQGGGGRKALEIKTINAKGFEKLDAPKYQHVGQLNFYLKNLNMRKGEILYVNRENPSQVKTYTVHYSQSRFEKDMRKLNKVRQIAADMMGEGLADSYGYSYSWLDRLNILADVAPVSKEFKEAKQLVQQQMKYGLLSEKDIEKYQRALKHRQTRLRKYELYPNRFKGKIFSPDTERNIQSINEDIQAGAAYSLPERAIGALWETFTNSNNFLTNKFFAFKDPLEHYKLTRLYGREYKPWDEVWSSFGEPTVRGMAAQTDPIGGAYRFGMTGFVLGGPGISAISALIGSAYGSTHGMFRTATNSAYIPGIVQEQRDIEKFFDQAKFSRFNRLSQLSDGLVREEYLQAKDATLTAFNQSGESVANLFRATPYMEKPYIEPWLNARNANDRQEILKFVPPQLGEALKRQWHKNDMKDNTSQYIKNSSDFLAAGGQTPAFDRSILDPSVQLEDIKLKTVEDAGFNAHDFGLGWNQQLLRMQGAANEIQAANLSARERPDLTGPSLNAEHVRLKVNEIIRDFGLTGRANVYINEGASDVNVVDVKIRRDRSRTIINALDRRKRYMGG